MNAEEKLLAKMILFVILATLLMVLGMYVLQALQMQACVEAGMKWSCNSCWEEQV